jgi:hypothetical protein
VVDWDCGPARLVGVFVCLCVCLFVCLLRAEFCAVGACCAETDACRPRSVSCDQVRRLGGAARTRCATRQWLHWISRHCRTARTHARTARRCRPARSRRWRCLPSCSTGWTMTSMLTLPSTPTPASSAPTDSSFYAHWRRSGACAHAYASTRVRAHACSRARERRRALWPLR